jgi:hypothetical protein
VAGETPVQIIAGANDPAIPAVRAFAMSSRDLANQRLPKLMTQMTVHYARLDGSAVRLPCVKVFRMRGDLSPITASIWR